METDSQLTVEERLARLERWAEAVKAYIQPSDPHARAKVIDALPVVEDGPAG